jgi:hypothetical protein
MPASTSAGILLLKTNFIGSISVFMNLAKKT